MSTPVASGPPKRLYDMVFLVVPERDEQAALAIVEDFRKLLLEHGAVMEKDETMGRRRLAYTIKKRNEATYHNFLFRADSKAVTEVQRRMRISDDILRYLSVRIDEELKHGAKVAKRTKVRTPRPSAMPMSEPEHLSPAEPGA